MLITSSQKIWNIYHKKMASLLCLTPPKVSISITSESQGFLGGKETGLLNGCGDGVGDVQVSRTNDCNIRRKETFYGKRKISSLALEIISHPPLCDDIR